MSATQAAGPAPQPILSIRGIVKHFGGVVAVDGSSFDIERGSITGLIGPNGAGKTTCFNMLNGQLRPDSGSIRFKDREIVGLAPRQVWRLGVGRTFQITEIGRAHV